ncbi:cysteine hydrolase [Novosphingobium flavum]|uniref:Cysteine hydrolase n=1 Tax=Novosphingobium flavum TaxID=1778672 RepID=A0A7X1FRZ7_9SPHN|nr:cysteine hydrolase [Novosphingobium flavum]MBC2665858.1 cysteine hydrolase [Novosphingobium flavum]
MTIPGKQILLAAAAGLAAFAAGAGAHAAPPPSIYDRWQQVAMPAPPPLKPVRIVPGETALLILDMNAVNCAKRPTCVTSVPSVKRLLGQARAHGMPVIYSAGAAGSTTPPEPPAEIAWQKGEPLVRAPVDKFIGGELERILAERKVKTLLVCGTSAEGAVLHTAVSGALRGFNAVVPVDCYSSVEPFAEVYTAWHLVNAPAAISRMATVTRSDLVTFP